MRTSEKVRGLYNGITPSGRKVLQHTEGGVVFPIDDIADEVAGYEQWIDDLQSEMYINCVYCGHRYPPGSGAVMQEVLYEHIKQCPKHPLSEAETRIAELLEALENAKSAVEFMAEATDSDPEDHKRLEDVNKAIQGG